jgi:hypothetical protein
MFRSNAAQINPGYDLAVARGDQLRKVSVKGSKDGDWG